MNFLFLTQILKVLTGETLVSISLQVPKSQHHVLRKPFIRSDSTDLFTDEFHYVQVAKYSVARPYLVIIVKETHTQKV